MAFELDVLRTVVGIGVLVFLGRVLATLCSRIKVPEVVGEVFAGIILGPTALGGLIYVLGGQLIELNDLLLAFALVGGVIVLFAPCTIRSPFTISVPSMSTLPARVRLPLQVTTPAGLPALMPNETLLSTLLTSTI